MSDDTQQPNITEADADRIAAAINGSTAEGRLAQAKAGMTENHERPPPGTMRLP